MSHRSLPSAFVKTVLHNGVGRHVCQMSRVTLKFCKSKADSRGMRSLTLLRLKTGPAQAVIPAVFWLGSIWVQINHAAPAPASGIMRTCGFYLLTCKMRMRTQYYKLKKHTFRSWYEFHNGPTDKCSLIDLNS